MVPLQKKLTHKMLRICSVLFISFFSFLSAKGQWATETFSLKPGWNSIYLNIDASYANIDDLGQLDSNIEEIWLWKPEVTDAQFIKSPDNPSNKKTRWLSWSKDKGPSSALQRLIGNSSYLIRYGNPDGEGNWSPNQKLEWKLKGRPLPPNYNWTSTGLNFIGFSANPNNSPSFDSYFRQSILSDLQFFQYNGGQLNDTNPSEVFALRNTKVTRGESYWVKSKEGKFNNYFSPFDLVLQDYRGVVFGENKGQYRIIIRNNTNNGLLITINHSQTENPPTSPAGLSNYVNGMGLMIRGETNPIDLTYEHVKLNSGNNHSVVLKPAGKSGSSQEVIIGLDRSSLEAGPGTLYGSILKFTDSLGHVLVNIPVSAIKTSNAGLWIGNAKVNEVRHDLTFFEKNPETKSIEIDDKGKAKIFSRDDTYGPVPNSYPLRLIMHQNSKNNKVKLYQRIYHGVQKGAEQINQTIITDNESDLSEEYLSAARRISAVHLPWNKIHKPWECAGKIDTGESLDVSVKINYNDHSSNPFLHTYHPDHDNLNPRFENELLKGFESFGIIRDIRLDFNSAPSDFDSLTKIQKTLTGGYNEIITIEAKGAEKKHYFTRGVFELNKISIHSALGKEGSQFLSDSSKDSGSDSSYIPTFSQGKISAKLYYNINVIKEAVPATYYTKDDVLPDGKNIGDLKTAVIPAVLEENTLYSGLNGLRENNKFPSSPDDLMDIQFFEFPNSGNIDNSINAFKDQYGVLIQGYFHPNKTGFYKFSLSAEDEGELYLSTDSASNNKVLIASSSSSETRNFSLKSNHSEPIHLQRGKVYYIEALNRDTTGSDSISVAMHNSSTIEKINDFSDADLPIPGSLLSPYVEPPNKPDSNEEFANEDSEDSGDE